MAQKEQSQQSKLLVALSVIAQLILLPVALGVALNYGLVGIQVFALAYLLLFVRGKVFPSQFFISPGDEKTIYYFLFTLLSATMWTAYLGTILPPLVESITVIQPDKQGTEILRGIANTLVFGPENVVPEDFLILPLYSHPALERWYWSMLVAFSFVMAIAALHLISSGRTMMNTYLAEYSKDIGDCPYWPTLWAMISIILDINKRVELVTDGRATTVKAPGGGWARFAGPGLLIVDDGHAVALEKGGKITRIVSAGITLTEAFERTSLIVPLRTAAILVDKPVRNVVTRDSVIIEEFNLFVYYQIDPGLGECPEGSEFPYDPEHIKRIWRLVGKKFGSIRSAMETIADTSLRDVIARYDLGEVFTTRAVWPSPATGQLEPRQRIKKAVVDQINRVSLESLGIKVVDVNIGEIKIQEKAEERLLQKWMADWDRRIETTKAETDKLVQVTEAAARMETIQAIAQGLRELLGKDANAQDLILLRFIEYLEKASEKTQTGTDDYSTLMRMDILDRMRMAGGRP